MVSPHEVRRGSKHRRRPNDASSPWRERRRPRDQGRGESHGVVCGRCARHQSEDEFEGRAPALLERLPHGREVERCGDLTVVVADDSERGSARIRAVAPTSPRRRTGHGSRRSPSHLQLGLRRPPGHRPKRDQRPPDRSSPRAASAVDTEHPRRHVGRRALRLVHEEDAAMPELGEVTPDLRTTPSRSSTRTTGPSTSDRVGTTST